MFHFLLLKKPTHKLHINSCPALAVREEVDGVSCCIDLGLRDL